jgi:4-azaleucine resistance transporter AzlC
LLGVVPFGMIYGVLALGAGLAAPVAQAMSAIVFAGSAQFVTTQITAAGAPSLVVILTVVVVNLRHALYSASVAPYLKALDLKWKVILSYLLTDEAYAVAITHYRDGDAPGNKHWFFLGAGLTLWSGWQLSTAAGVFLGARIAPSWNLDFTLALTFVALVVPMLTDRASVAAAVAGGAVAVLGLGLPYKLGLMLAAVVGVGTGMVAERVRR